MATYPQGRVVVWGAANSWIVHIIDGGRIQWCSQWFSDQAAASSAAVSVVTQRQRAWAADDPPRAKKAEPAPGELWGLPAPRAAA